MTRISKNRLDKSTSDRMFALFWRSLTRLGSQEETAEFFSDILSETEQVMIAKRYTAAILLAKGYNQTHIKKVLNLSYSTLGTVAGWLKNLKPATKKILDRHLKDEAWGQFFDKIDEVLDILPPGKYANWSKEGKEKYQRSLTRSARSLLR